DRSRSRSRNRRRRRAGSSQKMIRTSMACCGRCSSRSRKSWRGCIGRRVNGCMWGGDSGKRMLNVECSMLNVEWRRAQGRRRSHSTLNIQHSTFNIAFLLFLFALPAIASDLQVDKRTLSTDDALTITLTLTDAFASAENVQLPLQNLRIDASPSVSSEFSWINGQSSRRKVLRYIAYPI